jgi:hypothetical protein
MSNDIFKLYFFNVLSVILELNEKEGTPTMKLKEAPSNGNLLIKML